MHNNEIAAFINALENSQTLVIGDSAEPKSIDEIKSFGVVILPAEKKGFNNKSYLSASIDYMQQQKISVTKSSTNLIREYRNYLWQTDKDGKIINVPEGGFDHALDAARYAFDGLRPKQEQETEVSYSGNISSLWG